MSLKDFFRKKEHREKYEKAEKKYKGAQDAYRWTGSGRYVDGRFRYWSQSHYDSLLREENLARENLKRMYKSGQKEAIKLDKKYNSLIREFGKAKEKLYNFEEKELGVVHKDKKNIGNLLGIFSVGAFIAAGLFGSSITGNMISTSTLFMNISNSMIFLVIGVVLGIAWFFLKN